MFHNKKGAAILESAILYPFIVLTACCLLTMMISLYTMAITKAKCDLVVREAAGSLTKTVVCDEDTEENPDYPIKKSNKYLGLHTEITAQHTEIFELNHLEDYAIDKTEAASFNLHDECRFIRNVDLIVDGLAFVGGFIQDDSRMQ
jgi:hypothetical protein